MDMTDLSWHWEDLIKVGCSLLAGVILGLEREWKDKSAGFKTIAIICLGSTLFTLLSYKMGAGDSEDATRIASYVVSGIGFLGAGVIFKDGVNVNGLTTASIIWISAAIGMSIGFGQYITATVFLAACFFIIVSGPILNRYWVKNLAKTLEVHLNNTDGQIRGTIIEELTDLCYSVKLKQSRFTKSDVTLQLDIVIHKNRLHQLDQIFLLRPEVVSFCY
jgi:putative Mg2+ transporter-C (MgtC) family protein